MSEKQSDRVPMVPLTSRDLDRFHRHAPAALRRRGASFFFEQWAYSAEQILLGTIPIIGLLIWDWSAVALLFFLLVGTWTSIVCDLAKYAFLRPIVRREAEQYTNDFFVWVVAEAVREHRDGIPQSQAGAAYLPGMGLVVDLLFGGISTVVMMLVLATTQPVFPGQVLADRGYLLGLLLVIASKIIMTVWMILAHRLGKTVRPVKLHAGLRGAGLFVLMFIVLVISDKLREKADAARIIMIAANGLLILIGVLNAIGMKWVHQETVWLREYLREGQRSSKAT